MYISQCTSEAAFRISAEKKYFIAVIIENIKFLVVLIHSYGSQNLLELGQESCFLEVNVRK